MARDMASDMARRVSASTAGQGVLALLVYEAVWLAAAGAFPLVTHPQWAQLGQSGTDPNFYVWALRWWPYSIAHGLNPLHSAQVRLPGGANLAWVTTIPPLALIMAPITAIFGPVVSFNLLAAVSLPASAWAAFALCRRVTRRFWPALAGGAVFGFSNFETTHIASGQLNLSFSLLIPLVAYLVVLRWDETISSRAFVGLLALTMTAQFYLFLETFAQMTAMLAVALLAGYAIAGRARRPAVASLARLIGLAYLITVAAGSPYLWFALRHVPPGFARSPAGTSLDLLGLVAFSHQNVLGLTWLMRHGPPHTAWRVGGYVGIPLLIVAVASAAFTWSKKITRLLTVMLLVVIVAALGPTVRADGQRLFGLTWKVLWYLPLARSALPVRLMVFAFLALALIVAIWLAGPSKRQWARWLLAVPAVAGIIANLLPVSLSAGPGMPPFVTTGEYRHYLSPDEAIVVVSDRTNNAGMLWQAQTDYFYRLAGGFLNKEIGAVVPLPVAGLVTGQLTPAKRRAFQAFVRRTHVSAILVETGSSPRWLVVLTELGLAHLTVGGVTIYRTGSATHFIGSPQPRSSTPALFSASTTSVRLCAANVSTCAIMPP
jgi:hypothetical protein